MTAADWLKFVIAEDDPAGAPGAALRLRVGRAMHSASVLELSAPAPNSRSGVKLGGREVAANGSWSPPQHLRRIAVRGGVVALDLPAARAVLVTVSAQR